MTNENKPIMSAEEILDRNGDDKNRGRKDIISAMDEYHTQFVNREEELTKEVERLKLDYEELDEKFCGRIVKLERELTVAIDEKKKLQSTNSELTKEVEKLKKDRISYDELITVGEACMFMQGYKGTCTIEGEWSEYDEQLLIKLLKILKSHE